MNRRLHLLLLLLALGALALRLPDLDRRPLHNDEAVNATKVAQLWESGAYRYDPHEYHGPVLYYASLPFFWLSGAKTNQDLTDGILRLAPVFFGAALILLLALLRDGLGNRATGWAALFLALSPAMVFYSRYFIHEMLLVFFTLLACGAGYRYLRNPGPGWAILGGIAVGLMYATKETFVLTVGAALLALGILAAWNRLRDQAPWPRLGKAQLGHLAVGLLAMLVVAELFFSSFFTNAAGPLDALRTYLPWLKRAGGDSPHLHPPWYYLEHLLWFHPAKTKGVAFTEGALLALSLVGAGMAFARKTWPGVNLGLARFLALYSLVLTLIYSAIRYKTPWCLLSFYLGLILLAGLGAAGIWDALRGWKGRLAWGMTLALSCAHLAWEAWQLSFPLAADRRNPYAYSQTVPHMLELVDRLESLARVHPQGHQMPIQVMSRESYWPLPWYLRRFQRIGWWESLADQPHAPVMIVNSRLQAYFDEKTDKKWIMAGLYEFRPKVFLEMYVEYDLWVKFVETLPRRKPEE